LHGEVRGLLDHRDGEIAGRLDDACPWATDPGGDRGSVFVIMPPTGLTLLAAPTRSATQRLFTSPLGLALLTSGVIECIGFDRAL
jgi:hypothetical protein